MHENDVDAFFGFIAFSIIMIIALAIYFTPSIIAFYRTHPNRWLILVVNTVFGGTGLGWLGSLIWAFHAAHLSKDGSNGGESGLNLFVNDVSKVQMVPSEGADYFSQLEKIKKLMDDGIIDQAEFNAMKMRYLSKIT